MSGLILLIVSISLAAYNEVRNFEALRALFIAQGRSFPLIYAWQSAAVESSCLPSKENVGKLLHTYVTIPSDDARLAIVEAYEHLALAPVHELRPRTCYLSNFSAFGNQPGLRLLPDNDVTGIRIERLVEMYQWVETITTKSRADYVHGGTMTFDEYRYKKVWSAQVGDTRARFLKVAYLIGILTSQLVDDSSFVRPTSCAIKYNNGLPCTNPDPTQQRLNQELINLAGEPQVPRPICDTPSVTEKSSRGEKQVKSEVCGKDVRINGIYMHFLNLVNRSVANSQDAVGDVRLSYVVYKTDFASVLAMQNGNSRFAAILLPLCYLPLILATNVPVPISFSVDLLSSTLLSTFSPGIACSFGPWRIPNTNPEEVLYLLENGERTMDQMILDAVLSDTTQIWFTRALTFFLAVIGMVTTLSQVIPYLSVTNSLDQLEDTLPDAGSQAEERSQTMVTPLLQAEVSSRTTTASTNCGRSSFHEDL
ncbi:hypothetical protein GUITHDRAFT_109393 [Guillardia theta CCMP2712]|uniref:Uncharacterized protein n=1 Tax=Guillardia theta (strain CCMP2712) TaxID=905079 RepID=L1J8E1_GUITC|nr:hypothetical protein GUITHDRAFT_109393 [Guillardia theta CCMP2712]EKX44617.1 hypothetical protein GUITHDRAFT_109393 [Guillardia theta CCMP2712]|eukprot:XP_005831597.1 hypothetical protein GUITHDRAFT_109393 [Guillardia theta CCMP2712]